MKSETIISAPPGVPVLLRDLLHERTGIYFEDDRLETLLEKLRERAESHGCRTYLEYYYILKYDEKSPGEWLRVMDAFSVQETYFFREYSQIEALTSRIIPEWFAKSSAPLRIWSAACASGEEPYSLAIALDEAGLSGLPIEILASDASERALERARGGLYRERSFRSMSIDRRERYFQQSSEGWTLSPEIRERVRFQRANLVSAPEVELLASSAVIFCRNVFIYFSQESIRRVIATFAERMQDPAYLFVGASESLLKLTQAFELREIDDAFVYQRLNPKACS